MEEPSVNTRFSTALVTEKLNFSCDFLNSTYYFFTEKFKTLYFAQMAAECLQLSYTHFCTLLIKKFLMNSVINGKADKP